MKKTVIYIAGGGMSGVFGCGVMMTLQEKSAYPMIKAVYGASAGAMDGAYFLARELEVGASIYFNEARVGFIDLKKLWPGFMYLRKHGPIYPVHPDHYINVMHVDYLMDVVANKRKLDTTMLLKQPIPFYVKVLNQHTHQVEYLNIKRYDPLKVLRATISMPPLTFSYELLHHNRMVDSCIAEVIGAKYLLEKHKNDKVVVIVNRRPPPLNIVGRFLCKAEAYAGTRMYGQHYHDFPLARERRFAAEIEMLKQYKNVKLIMPPRSSQSKPQTTNLAKLKKTYALGRRAGERVWEFMSEET
ncbi:MAG TPA: hypothetical protein VG964_02770 [Candidatus Saccharimonadales bacterium]|nr:hypothetical protein [Candidatus Saccharimonadales bacterium]